MQPKRYAQNFFDALFCVRDRRLALLCRWLCIMPRGPRTCIDTFEYWIRALTTDKTAVAITDHGIRLNERMMLPMDFLLSDEVNTVQQMQNSYRRFHTHDGTFKYNDVALTDVHRQLLSRDFVTVIMLQYKKHERVLWPMYALHAVHRLTQDEHKNAALWDMEYALQGLAHAHEFPIYANRRNNV